MNINFKVWLTEDYYNKKFWILNCHTIVYVIRYYKYNILLPSERRPNAWLIHSWYHHNCNFGFWTFERSTEHSGWNWNWHVDSDSNVFGRDCKKEKKSFWSCCRCLSVTAYQNFREHPKVCVNLQTDVR